MFNIFWFFSFDSSKAWNRAQKIVLIGINSNKMIEKVDVIETFFKYGLRKSIAPKWHKKWINYCVSSSLQRPNFGFDEKQTFALLVKGISVRIVSIIVVANISSYFSITALEQKKSFTVVSIGLFKTDFNLFLNNHEANLSIRFEVKQKTVAPFNVSGPLSIFTNQQSFRRTFSRNYNLSICLMSLSLKINAIHFRSTWTFQVENRWMESK